jgi:hypothetical protein
MLRPAYTKDVQNVVRDTVLVLLGPSVQGSGTISWLLDNLIPLAIVYFCNIARTSDANHVAQWLKKGGSEMEITENVLIAASKNEEKGKEAIELLLE